MRDADLRVEQWIKQATEPATIIEVEGYGLLPCGQAGRDGLRAQKVATLDEVMQLRGLRNECRQWMTVMRDEITEERQLTWWRSVNGSQDAKIWLVYRRDVESAIGFLFLRRVPTPPGESEHWYITLGLTESERRKGYGTWLYAAARSLTDGHEVHALILETNEASIKAAARAGYVRQARATMLCDQIIKMVGSPQ
jgi:RimJ/RimL family protein N-acetyltransferase